MQTNTNTNPVAELTNQLFLKLEELGVKTRVHSHFSAPAGLQEIMDSAGATYLIRVGTDMETLLDLGVDVYDLVPVVEGAWWDWSDPSTIVIGELSLT